ncbi:MAG: cadherin domain-containing protein [Granulosicoccus sp.]
MKSELKCQHRTLIDTLETRLMFSADHPLGFSVGADDLHEFVRQSEESAISSAAREMAKAMALRTTDFTGSSPKNAHLPSDIEQSGTEETVSASGLTTRRADQDLMLADDPNPFIVLQVTTTDDVVDASDMSSLSAFNTDKGEDDEMSLREAIMVANADPAVDVIQLENETYKLTLDTGEKWDDDSNQAGDLDLSRTYVIRGVVGEDTVIDQGVDDRRVFELEDGTVTFSDLTIKGGDASTGFNEGGGIYIHESGSAFFENVVFENNKADDHGGAIYTGGTIDLETVTISGSEAKRGAGIYIAESGAAVIHESTLTGNKGTDDGGGIVADGNLELYDSELTLNRVDSDDASDNTRGGALFVDTTSITVVVNSVFTDNFAKSDGGAIHNHGDLTVTDSYLLDNTAERRGAGLHSTGEAALNRVVIMNNNVNGTSQVFAHGGGIYSDEGADLSIDYSIIAANSSTHFSGGIGLDGGANISNSIVVNNIAPFGAAGIATRPANDVAATVTLTNTIAANNYFNDTAAEGFDVYGWSGDQFLSDGFNFVGNAVRFEPMVTDIVETDLGIFTVELEDGAVKISTEPTNVTVNSGKRDSSGDLTIAGTLVGETPNIGGYTTTETSGMVFWSDDGGAIFRSDSNFLAAQQILQVDVVPLDIEVDVQRLRVFWLDPSDYSIKSANYDGTDIVIEQLVNENSVAFAVDSDSQRLFVAVEGTNPAIVQYITDDPESPETLDRSGELVKSLIGSPTDVEFNSIREVIYWTELGTSEIETSIKSLETVPVGADPTTSEVQLVVVNASVLIEAHSLAINEVSSDFFWSEPDLNMAASYTDDNTSTDDTSSINYLEYGTQDDPLALTYDDVNQRLLVSIDETKMHWVNFETQDEGYLTDPSSNLTHMAFAQIVADETAVSDSESIEAVTNGLTLQEGGTRELTDDDLKVEQSGTKAQHILLTLDNDPSEIIIFRNSEQKTSFTQHDIDKGRITFHHVGEHIGLQDSWIVPLEFTISTEEDTTSTVVLNVTVTNVDDAPVLILSEAEALTVQQGAEVDVTFENLDATDPDSDFEELVFSVPLPETIPFGEFLRDGSPVSEFTKKDIENELVTFRQSGNQPAGTYTIAGIEVRDATTQSVSQEMTVVITAALVDPVFSPNPAFDLAEGGQVVLTNSVLGVVDSDTAPDQVVFTLAGNGEVEGELYVDNVKRSFFTLEELESVDEELQTVNKVEFRHSGAEPTVDASLSLDVSDGQVTLSMPRIDFDVQAVNDNPPVAIDHSFATKYKVPLETEPDTEGSLLFGMTDIDEGQSDTFLIEILSFPAKGILSSNPDGSFIYTPPEDQVDVDYIASFDYVIRDSADNVSNQANVEITVQALQAPVVNGEISDETISELQGFSVSFPETLFSTSEDALPFVWKVADISQTSAVSLPDWLTFDADTRTLSGVPDDSDTGLVNLEVKVIDTNGLVSAPITFDITVDDVNQAPVIVSAEVFAVDENDPLAVVGNIGASDPDENDVLTYHVVSADSPFTFDGNVLKLKSGDSLDYEENSIIEVTIQARDPAGLYDELLVNVDVNNVNDAPKITPVTYYSVKENTLGDEAGSLTIFDQDVASDLDVTFSDSRFEIVNNKLRLKSDVQLDYDVDQFVELNVVLSDGTENDSVDLVINVIGEQAPLAVETVANISVEELGTLEYTFSETLFSSADNAYPFTWQVTNTVGSVPDWLVFDAETRSLTGNPGDADTGTLLMEVLVTDSNGRNSSPLEFSLEVIDINQQPIIHIDDIPELSVSENMSGEPIGVIEASDPDENDSLTYTVDDTENPFEFDNNVLKLKEFVSLDFETNDSYTFDITVTDGSNVSVTESVNVLVTDKNESPVLDPIPRIEVYENQTNVFTASGSDVDGGQLVYAIVGGADGALFSVDPTSGVVMFNTTPDREAPQDVGSDNVYRLMLQVADSAGAKDSQGVEVEVLNQNEMPEIIVPPSISVFENQLEVFDVESIDVDGGEPAYSIDGGDDADMFTIVPSTGVLTFTTAPDREAPGDVNGDNTYNVLVRVDDGNGAASIKSAAITVENINETPVLNVSETLDVAENSTLVTAISGSDVDSESLSYSIRGGADASRFHIDSTSGQLSFNFIPDYEAPLDANGNGIYDLIIGLSDGDINEELTVSKNISVTVTNINEPPVLNLPERIEAAENQTTVITASRTDIDDGDDMPTYSISGEDAEAFEIDSTSGVITFNTTPDREAPADSDEDNNYQLVVTVSDVNDSNNTSSQALEVTVTNINEPPVLNLPERIEAAENQMAVITASSSDIDEGDDAPTYSISGEDAEVFEIDSTSGVITFNTAPDREAPADSDEDNSYQLVVTVSDGNDSNNTSSQTLEVTVTNINEPPVLNLPERVEAAENQTAVITASSTDIDEGDDTPTYSISGEDAEAFKIDSTSGVITFNTVPDREAPADSDEDNNYQIIVTVSDGNDSNNTSSQALEVTVTNINELPDILLPNTVNVAENQTAVAVASSTDVDDETLTYSLGGGEDAALFAIDSSSGVLSFLSAPDRENPIDSDADNVYRVTVYVKDENSGADSRDVKITVTDVNEPPDIVVPALVDIAENQTAVLTASSIDEDGDKPIYSISEGADAALFVIDSVSGELSFQSAPNFEMPADAARNNIYVATLQVADGQGNRDTSEVSIRVVDQNDAPEIAFNGQVQDQVLDSEQTIVVGPDNFIDQDDDDLSFSMTLRNGQPLPDWIVFDQQSAELQLGLPPSESVNEIVLLSVSDGRGGVAEMLFEVGYVFIEEPQLQAAAPQPQAISFLSEFERANPVSPSFKPVDTGKSTVGSASSYAVEEDSDLADDAVLEVASVSVDVTSGLLGNRFFNSAESDSRDSSSRTTSQDNVISEYLSGQRVGWENAADSESGANIFDGTVDIANLFAMVRQQDPEMFASLSESSEKRREEMEAQFAQSRGVVSTAVTTTSGLSIGYVLYLLRGGAIMSSMLSSLPAWRFVDPLPIVGSLGNSLDVDGESLQSIVKHSPDIGKPA